MARKMAAVRAFLRFTLGKGRVPDMPLGLRKGRRLPDAPAPPEIEAMLEGMDGDGPLPLRNRALVELVYSAGLRASEAVGLDLGDVDFEQEIVHVHGKGGKERVVPLGEEASYRLQRYLREGGPKLVRGAENAFFVSARGRRLDTSTLRRLLPTRTGCATRSRRTCSRAEPICARSRSCSATARSRPRRSTATSTRAGCGASTTARILAPRYVIKISPVV